MRTSVLSTSLLFIGLAAMGCRDGGAQGKLDPNLPVVSVKIKGMT